MAEFSINKTSTLGGSVQLDQIATKLMLYQAEVEMIRGSLAFQIASASNIKSRLKAIEQDMYSERRGSRNMASGLQKSVQKYRSTEMRIVGRAVVHGRLEDVLKRVFPYSPQLFKDIPEGLKGISEFLKKLGAPNLKDYKDLAHLPWASLPFLKGLDIPGLKDMIQYGPSSFGDLASTYKNVKDWVEGLPDQLIAATTATGSVAASWAFWDASVEGKYGSAGISALSAKAYAEGSAGLFSKTDDGDLYLNPHIDAKAGASFTALHVDGEAHIGNNMLGAKASGSADVGRVAAEGSVSAGILNSKGELDPRLNANASVEAIAVEAKAEAGVTVLGTEAKVSGSVNVGIGAHANVGYKDGVVSFDIGASLGIGASVGFEVDIGGTVDAVKGAAKSAFKSIFKW